MTIWTPLSSAVHHGQQHPVVSGKFALDCQYLDDNIGCVALVLPASHQHASGTSQHYFQCYYYYYYCYYLLYPMLLAPGLLLGGKDGSSHFHGNRVTVVVSSCSICNATSSYQSIFAVTAKLTMLRMHLAYSSDNILRCFIRTYQLFHLI
jgi:hypothetical protein